MSKNDIQAYGQLSSLFYDVTEQYASEQEVNFFASFIKQHPGRVLEAMSGSGRLQIPLAKQGFVIDGVDHSSAMIARYQQRCTELMLKPDIVYQQPLENLVLPYKYSTVIIAVASLQLLTDEDIVLKALKNLNAHMLPSGNLLIDTFVPDATIDDYSISTVRIDARSIIRLTKRHVFDIEKKLANSFCFYELIVDGIVQQQEDELIEFIWRSDDEWKDLLLKAGFEVIQMHDEILRKSEPSRIIHARAIIKN